MVGLTDEILQRGWVTVREVRLLFPELSYPYICNKCRNGTIEAFKVGREWRINLSELSKIKPTKPAELKQRIPINEIPERP